MDKKVTKNSYIYWSIATVFSFLQFFLQIANNGMTDGLMLSFHINSAQVGLLSSAFFYPFILMQIPAGYLLERFSSRAVLSLAAFICAAGTVLFSITYSFSVAIIARILMGLGASMGFLGMLNIIRMWFPIKFFSLLVGVSELLAMSATAISEKLFVESVLRWGWRHSLLILAGIILIVAISLLFISDRKLITQENPPSFLPQLMTVIKNKNCWYAGIFGCGLFSVVTAFSALWGLKFLAEVYQYSIDQASSGISMVLFGLAIGCPVIGFLNANMKNKSKLMLLASLFAFGSTAIIISHLISHLSIFIMSLLFIMGFSSGAYFLCYEMSAQAVEDHYKSMAMAFCSMQVMLGAILFQPLMGLILEWRGYTVTSPSMQLGNFSKAFQLAMVSLLFIQLLAVIAACLLRKNRAHSLEK